MMKSILMSAAAALGGIAAIPFLSPMMIEWLMFSAPESMASAIMSSQLGTLTVVVGIPAAIGGMLVALGQVAVEATVAKVRRKAD